MKMKLFVIALTLSAGLGQAPALAHAPETDAVEPDSTASALQPYPLETCIVSGEALTSMGGPVIEHYGDREVRFCCAGCIATFEGDIPVHLRKIDAANIARQTPEYPLEACVVSGAALGSMGEPVDHLHAGRLVRFCCGGCVPTFAADPAPYIEKLDAAQRAAAAAASSEAETE
jgi:hypothetical protein